MSTLSRFMTTAAAILDERDARKDQPPFFVRTTWLFAELEELTQPDETDTFTAIKVCRIRGDIAQVGRLADRIHASSATMQDPQRHQRQQICGWIKDQIARETKQCR